ncbi:hypothetical protein V6N11_071968 [Hibiscus sabdariffa]|uniref:RNase H type-1 domain-containing protein n=1 Tax=Hibiscus sabdariffa TaxID=183260 RepID=A0ABR2U1N0_9ROSI
MSLAYELGYMHLVVESGSLDAINLTKDLRVKQNSPIIVLYIHESCGQPWEVWFSHIRREGNVLVDRLTKLAYMDKFDLVAFTQPPLKVHPFLFGDGSDG